MNAALAERALLVACAHAAPSHLDAAAFGALTAGQWMHVVQAAGRQRIRPLVLQALTTAGVLSAMPAAVRDVLTAECRAISRQNLAIHAEMNRLAQVFSERGIAVIVLKGAYLDRAAYPGIGMREMDDLDILVHRADLEAAVQACLDSGYHPRRPFSTEADAEVHSHVSRLVKAGTAIVEIHWSVTPPSLRQTIDPEELWAGSVPWPVAGSGVRALSAQDSLLHTCYHAAYHHYFEMGLRPLCDVARIVSTLSQGLDWDAVCRAARERRWNRGVYMTLAMARDLIGVQVPESVLSGLVRNLPAHVVMDAAAAELFETASDGYAVNVNVARIMAQGWRGRIALAWQRLFPPAAVLQARYATSADADVLPSIRRRIAFAAGLAAKHAASLWKMTVQADPHWSDRAENKLTLHQWLMPDPAPRSAWRRWHSLSAADRTATRSMAVVVPVVALSLRVFDFRRTLSMATRMSIVPSERGSHGSFIDALAGACGRVARRSPLAGNCLSRSLALWWLLRRRGISADLRLGVALASGVLEAHAWVEHNGRVLNDRQDVSERFRPLTGAPDRRLFG
jgi:hypothetical protein